MAAKHTPPGDDSFRASLLRNLGGGAALILLVAAVFFGVGRFGGEDATPEVAGSAGDEDAASQAQQEEEPAPEPEPEPDEAEEPDEVEEADEPEPEEPEAEEEPAGDDDAAEEADESDEAEPDEPADASSGLQPSDISVQVLDGVGTDSGAASQRVASELDDLGYRIIARNPALAYEQTTVLWTSGNEDRARKVAADLGVSAVRQQPGNLSEQVDVHVVVGADRA
jgi:outer membrane biosynthesis protein TonB